MWETESVGAAVHARQSAVAVLLRSAAAADSSSTHDFPLQQRAVAMTTTPVYSNGNATDTETNLVALEEIRASVGNPTPLGRVVIVKPRPGPGG